MAAADFLFYDGKILKTGSPLISPDNRSFRYGDGCFETMKLADGQIALADHHFERLFASLELLRFRPPSYFTATYLTKNIVATAKKNRHLSLARIRVNVFRGEGGLYDSQDSFPHHIIQTWALDPVVNRLNENGLVMDIFKDARKVCDRFSHIKNNNYLANVMAALWAKENKLNDAILLNPYDRVADATIANVFMVKDGRIQTPSLAEGAVDGVMRKYLLHCLRRENIPVQETGITVDELLGASEVFITNAIQGIRWVQQIGQSHYSLSLASTLHQKFFAGT